MSKKFNDTVFVKGISKKCVSAYGNPSYWVGFVFKDDTRQFLGFTASNAQCGYTVGNFIGRIAKIEYRYSKKGNIIIDNIKEVNKYEC